MIEPCVTRLEMGRVGRDELAMKLEARKHIVGRQALILAIASLVSFVLPMTVGGGDQASDSA